MASGSDSRTAERKAFCKETWHTGGGIRRRLNNLALADHAHLWGGVMWATVDVRHYGTLPAEKSVRSWMIRLVKAGCDDHFKNNIDSRRLLSHGR